MLEMLLQRVFLVVSIDITLKSPFPAFDLSLKGLDLNRCLHALYCRRLEFHVKDLDLSREFWHSQTSVAQPPMIAAMPSCGSACFSRHCVIVSCRTVGMTAREEESSSSSSVHFPK